MHVENSAYDSTTFGVQGRSPAAEVQEAGGSLLARGTGARSSRNGKCGETSTSTWRGVRGRAAPAATASHTCSVYTLLGYKAPSRPHSLPRSIFPPETT